MTVEEFDLIVGTPIHSADAEEIGTVKEVSGAYFKIDAPMAPDFWLPVSLVRSAHHAAVVLQINKDAIGGYEVAEEDLDAAPDDGAAPEGFGGDLEGSDTERDLAVEAAAIVWGPDEWAVVRARIIAHASEHSEADLDRMHERDPLGLRERFAHLLDDADRSAEDLARTVEENT